MTTPRPDLGYTRPVRARLEEVLPRLALWALASACAPAPLDGVEPWRSAPEVRLAVLSSDEGVQVWALDARAPVRAELEAAEGAELWLLGYRGDTLRAAFPGLAGVDVAALPARCGGRKCPPSVSLRPTDATVFTERRSQRPTPNGN